MPENKSLHFFPKLDWSHQQLRDKLTVHFSVEEEAKDCFQFLLKLPEKSPSVVHFNQVGDLNLKPDDVLCVDFNLLPNAKQPKKQEKQNKADTEGVIRVTISDCHSKPITEKNNKGGKFWEEKKLSKEEILGTVAYKLPLRFDLSPEDIQDELLKHFNMKEEAKDFHHIFLSTTNKKTNFKIADFKQLKDLNLDKSKPVF